MAKVTKTIRQALQYPPQLAHCFAANAALFNQVCAFYFEVIQAHEGILSLNNQEALRALEHLTHATRRHPNPIMPLSDIAPDIPAMFRRAAINAALGSARAFFSSLNKWRRRKEKDEARPCKKGKKKRPFRERPPVPPRTRRSGRSCAASSPCGVSHSKLRYFLRIHHGVGELIEAFGSRFRG